MLAYYDNKPSVLEAVGNGSYKYRFNITEKTPEAAAISSDDGNAQEEQKTQWQCQEVIVWPPISSNTITEAVITEIYDHNYEQKLINEYNAAQLGIYSTEEKEHKILKYKNFLAERNFLKKIIDDDCAELGIL